MELIGEVGWQITNKKTQIGFQVKGSMEGFPIVLVGNKCDEESGKRQVSTKTGEALEVNNKITKRTFRNVYTFTENVESQIHGDFR